MLNESPERREENPRAAEPQPDDVEYVGAPTALADAEEVPGWLANLVRAIVFIPTALGALLGLEIILLVILFVCVLLGVLAFTLS